MLSSYSLCALLAWSSIVAAQSISPANSSTANGLENGDDLSDSLQLAIAHSSDSTSLTVFPIAGLTSQAQHYTPNQGYRGPILLANASSQLRLDNQDIAFISCDPYTGNIQPTDVYTSAIDTNVSAIVLYSERSAGCMLDGESAGDYDRVYSMRTSNSTREMLGLVNALDTGNNAQTAYAFVAPRDAISDSSSNNGTANDTGNGNQQQQNALGPSPSTAVAMIILYSITGVITALFLIIITMGAVRAHRHPERYGPRNGVGRPRQSRARGLAMAMLETIPIVKFGDREQDPKSSDVELAEGRHGQAEVVPEQDAIRAAPTETDGANDETNKDGLHETSRDQPEAPAAEGGIGGAVANDTSKPNEDNQGCSICTEDFQLGEDQRVLPCDHRFHPACIDPWLLNVSGTCPLCRIDLRPNEDGPENPDHVLREGEPGEMPPPLAEQNVRPSVRASILAGIMGVRRPERMSREERLAALRRYRAQQSARRVAERRESEGLGRLNPTRENEEGEAEAETSVRSRLRNAFRVRTRRTGEEEGRDTRREGTYAGGVGRA